MSNKTYTRSFNGGIVSPEMYGRLDDVKNNTGLAVCRNFVVTPQGPVVNRPGTQFVREVKTSAKATRLIPFRYSATQTVVIEAGNAYFRFHSFGATLLTPTTGVSAWDVATAYVAGDLVTRSGSTWYAVAGSTGSDPATPANQYGATPVITATWVQDVGPVLSAAVILQRVAVHRSRTHRDGCLLRLHRHGQHQPHRAMVSNADGL
jgi:hypothetical protein